MGNDTQTLTLTEFLLARIAEDEERARVGAFYPEEHTGWLDGRVGGSYVGFTDRFAPARVLAECAAKRRIVESHHWHEQTAGRPFAYERIGEARLAEAHARALAAVYADHPDYRQEWAT